MYYQGTAEKIVTGALRLLDSERMPQQSPGGPIVANAVASARELRKFFALTDGPRIHEAFLKIVSSPATAGMHKRLALEYWLALDAGRFAKSVPDFPPTFLHHTPWLLLVPAVILLHRGQTAQARDLLRKVLADDGGSVADELAKACSLWYRSGLVRMAMTGWRALWNAGLLSGAQRLVFAQFLADSGQWKKAVEAADAGVEAETPEDEFRLLFLEGIRQGADTGQLREAVQKTLARHPAMPSVIKVFSPFIMQLYFRLEGGHSSVRDRRLSGVYAALLEAEWSAGVFHADSLIVGCRFCVCAGFIREAMAVMEQCHAKNQVFVDGFASLAFYAWCEGDLPAAEACLEREPRDRPHQAAGWLRMATVAGLLGQTEQAADFLEQMVRTEPGFPTRSVSCPIKSVLAITFKTLGWLEAAQGLAHELADYPPWRYRRTLYERAPSPGKPVEATRRILHGWIESSV